MAQAKQNSKMSTGAKVGIGAGVAALAAAAAGAYYFYGSKDAGKNRKAMKGWMVKAKGEVMEKMEGLKDISEEKYDQVVDAVIRQYGKMKRVDPAEMAALAAELRGSWKKISAHLKSAARPILKGKTKHSPKRSKPPVKK